MDRVSGLPDDVICHVLSFLPTQSFVRTSALAKRWRFLWADVPFLGFTCNGGICRECREEQGHKRNLNTFHTSNHEFEPWVVDIFSRNVRNLVIRPNYPLRLPRLLFDSKSLVDLCVFDCGGIPMEGTMCFPSLTRLRLVNVEYDDDDSLHQLISGCPVLEELITERMVFFACLVASSSLNRLVMDMDKVVAMKLDNPALQYLRLRVYKYQFLSAYSMDSLIEADIDLRESKPSCFCHVLHMVGMMSNVKCLTLSTPRLEALDSSFNILVTSFQNLTELNLRADWRFITRFLENANNLRVFTICGMVDHNDQWWKEPEEVPSCLISHLETMNLVDFGWSTEHEFDMVRYILKNAKLLKTMKIVSTGLHELDPNKDLEALKRLSLFERGSEACQLTSV